MVSITINNVKGKEYSAEFAAANRLREMLLESIPASANGEIIIANDITLPGQDPRDVDILVVGKLENCVFDNYYTNAPQYTKKALCIDGFCVVVELKQHEFYDIRPNGTDIEVRYRGMWKSATHQNEKQRYSVMNYFFNAFDYKPWVTNFIWLKSITSQQLSELGYGNPIGALPSHFTFQDMVDMMIIQNIYVEYDKNGDKMYHIKSSYDRDTFFDDYRSLFTSTRPSPTGLTRKKLDILIQKKANNTLCKLPIGKELTVLTGKAGTGKTFNLIEAALQLASQETGARCLLLTYNHALVSDIRRLLHFMDIPDGIDNYTIQIKTLHSFFLSLMEMLSVNTDNICGKRFEMEYAKSLKELKEIITTIMDENDLRALKDNNELAIDWDYILIDEGQDWSNDEKEILFSVYGSDRIIVADGEDQFIRSNRKQIWQKNVTNAVVKKQTNGLRQKSNLSEFANAFAIEVGLNWKVKPNNIEGWSGGHIIIKKHYDAKLHHAIEKYANSSGCDNYDILFLVPPEMVDEEHRSFKNISLWKEKGIHVFDGTVGTNRQSYPTDIRQCRLFQYDSCRGLEGWVTICLHFDELIKYKIKEAEKQQIDSLTLETVEESIKQYVYLWALMPLTRPIDTLIITLRNEDSEVGRILKKISERYQFVHWDIN